MKIIWDKTKNLINQQKHRLSFELAQLVFSDPLNISVLDRVEQGEHRWQTIGMVDGIVLILVAHTANEHDGVEIIRIISARKADKKERRIYEQGT